MILQKAGGVCHRDHAELGKVNPDFLKIGLYVFLKIRTWKKLTFLTIN